MEYNIIKGKGGGRELEGKGMEGKEREVMGRMGHITEGWHYINSSIFLSSSSFL